MVDADTLTIGEALRDEAGAAGADAVLMVMDERATDGTEPPATVAAALAACDVFIAPDHAVAQPHERAQARDRRGRAGRDDAGRDRGHARARDGGRLRRDGRALESGGRRCSTRRTAAHVTCPRGTDLRLALDGRAGIADDGDLDRAGRVREPARAARAFIAPAYGEGTIVASSLAPLGLSRRPGAC